jgi:hypothetical protein
MVSFLSLTETVLTIIRKLSTFRVAFTRDADITPSLTQALQQGRRALATGFTFVVGSYVRGVFIIRYRSTLHENRGGRYN